MRFVISGGAGFIGSHLCEYLLGAGHSVVSLDNLSTGSKRNIEHLLSNPKFESHVVDVTRSVAVGGNVHCVMHLASLRGPEDWLRRPIEALEAGSSGTRHMLQLAVRHEARFLLVNTWDGCDAGRRFAEAMTAAYRQVHGVKTAIARIGDTYGPRMRLDDGRVLSGLLAQALDGRPLTVRGDGSQTRGFTYVTDIVRGLFLLSQSDEGHPANLGHPGETTILELAEAVCRLSGTDAAIEFLPPEEDSPRPEIGTGAAPPGWAPEVSLEEGLRLTLDDVRARYSAESREVRA